MALTNTNSLVTIQDGQGAAVAQVNGGQAIVTAGGVANFSLTSTSGIVLWTLKFNCPAYPALHNYEFQWRAGMANVVQVPVPPQPTGSGPIGSALNQIQYTSTVSDGISGIGTSQGLLMTKTGQTPLAQHQARAVILSALQAYTNNAGTLTENGNGALASMDGIALAVGDVVFLPPGIAAAAADVGLYQVVGLGSAGSTWTLTRALDMPQGSLVLPGTEIRFSEGTVYGGCVWVLDSTAGPSTIGTTAQTWFPRQVTQTITLVAGTVTVTNVPIKSATKVAMRFTRITPNTTASTIDYVPIGAITTGNLGTASFAFQAAVAAGTINVADISTGNLTIINNV